MSGTATRRRAHETKNRQANELRAQAAALREEMLDATKTLSLEEARKKNDAILALEMRAQAAGGFTPDEEVERQGGDEDADGTLERRNTDFSARRNPDAGAEGDDALDGASGGSASPRMAKDEMERRIKVLQTNIRRHFGGINNYMRAVVGQSGPLSAKQERVLQDAQLLTRTIVGTASDASGGEFLLPLQQVESIFRVDNTIPGLLQRARKYSVRGRTLRIPTVKQTNANISRPLSGISAVTIVGEGSAKPVREPAFIQRLMTIYKIAAISQFGDETIEDDMTGELQPAVAELVGQEILNFLNDLVTISGSGTSEPLAALHTSANAALIKVTRQTQNRIKFADAVNMYVRHTHGPNSFWMVSRRALAEIFQFELSAGSPLVWLSSMVQNPTGAQLLGYPIVPTDFLNTLGSESDFALVNPDFYAVGLRKALTIESSIHYAFVNDITTWRFLARGGGIPIPDGTYAYKSPSSTKVDEHSPFVTLDDVYV